MCPLKEGRAHIHRHHHFSQLFARLLKLQDKQPLLSHGFWAKLKRRFIGRRWLDAAHGGQGCWQEGGKCLLGCWRLIKCSSCARHSVGNKSDWSRRIWATPCVIWWMNAFCFSFIVIGVAWRSRDSRSFGTFCRWRHWSAVRATLSFSSCRLQKTYYSSWRKNECSRMIASSDFSFNLLRNFYA